MSARASTAAAARSRLAVDDVSLDVAEGEFLAIVGGSGSGKTTLLRLANRLIDADNGSIPVEGEDVRTRRSDRAAPPHRLRVPERRPVSAYERRREYRRSRRSCSGVQPREIAARVDELLDLVRLDRAPIPRPLSARTVGRPAPARRRRPRAGGEAADRADGRAVRRARSPHPRRARRRLSRPARASSA